MRLLLVVDGHTGVNKALSVWPQLTLMYRSVAFGEIEMRKIVGNRNVTALTMASTQTA